jgi:pyruvate/2-oxoglutarate dehydrogenase complex dihydrolipoamide acyltransferase (E2) component
MALLNHYGQGLAGGARPKLPKGEFSEASKKAAQSSPWLNFVKQYRATNGKHHSLKVIAQAYKPKPAQVSEADLFSQMATQPKKARKARARKAREPKGYSLPSLKRLARTQGLKLSHVVDGKRKNYTKSQLMQLLNL